ncbi:MAG: HPr family phosphocarrier protein, partial [Thermanaerothrix sp.]|nr:HPr family phosphocarrier protein [Thermanaerothrix sp.]
RRFITRVERELGLTLSDDDLLFLTLYWALALRRMAGGPPAGDHSGARVEVVVGHPAGLHARPAALFVKTAAQFPCEIQVARVDRPHQAVNAKSILSVLGLGVKQGDRILIETRGEQCHEALDALVTLIESNFGESAEGSHG